MGPLRGRLNIGSWRVPRIHASASRQAADHADCHVLIANNLTAQPDTGQTSRGEQIFFGDGQAGRLSRNKLDAASGAAGIPAAGVQLVNTRILFQCQHQPFSWRHFKLANPLHG